MDYPNLSELTGVIRDSDILIHDKGEFAFIPNHEMAFHGCKLTLRTGRAAFIVSDTQFTDCIVDARRELKSVTWVRAKLRNCKFLGKYEGCEFGHKSLVSDHGELRNCDFSEARLDQCPYWGCALDDLKLPKWPCFTIVRTPENLRKMIELQWPEELGYDIRVLETQPSDCLGISYYAPRLMKQNDMSEGEFKASIGRLDCIM